jgi:hypothetical protein
MSKLAGLVAMVCLSACATRTGKVAGVVAGGSTLLAVASFSSSCDGGGDECELGHNIGGALLLGVAGVALVTAAIAEARHTPEVAAPLPLVRETPKPVPRKPADPAVVELMVSASVEASVGRCVTVRELATRVNQMDKDFYETVFRVDPAIQRCDR